MRDLTWQHARNLLRRLRSWWERRAGQRAVRRAARRLQQCRERAFDVYDHEPGWWP